jgi:hypothetical protein
MKRLWIAISAIMICAVAASAQLETPRAQVVQRQRALARQRLMKVVGLAEALELNEIQALRMADVMRRYDERKAPLQVQNAELAKVIKRASEGDSAAVGQVDRAIQTISDNRVQVQQLDREMMDELGRNLSPQQRAKLMIFFVNFADEQRNIQQRMQARQRENALKAAAERAAENAPK